MSSLAIDHVIIVVQDLDQAEDQFQRMGFTIIPGGVHSGNLTHNALVPFPNGTYLELLATIHRSSFSLFNVLNRLRILNLYTRRETEINRRLIENIAYGVGMVDFVLSSPDLSHEISLNRKAGLKISDPIPGGRIRPDGQEISWRTAVPSSTDIPFLMEDLTSKELRVPPVSEKFHANKIQGIHGVSVLVSSFVESLPHYQCLLGKEPSTDVRFPQPGTQNIQFNLEEKFISLSGILPGTSTLHKILAGRPAKPLGIFFQTADKKPGDLLSLTYSQDRGTKLSRSHKLI